MRWLEGWFGTASGVLGIIVVLFAALLIPVTTQTSQSEICSTMDGTTSCSTAYGPGAPPPVTQPNVAALIVLGVALLLFIGVLVGTWLDLSGRRRVGRIILLTSVTLLLVAPLLVSVASHGLNVVALAFVFPLTFMAFAAGVVACVRRDEPRDEPRGEASV